MDCLSTLLVREYTLTLTLTLTLTITLTVTLTLTLLDRFIRRGVTRYARETASHHLQIRALQTHFCAGPIAMQPAMTPTQHI